MSIFMGGPKAIDPPRPLKPCPFCGQEPIYWWDGSNYFITCGACLMRGPEQRTTMRLIEAWNTRKP